MNLPKGTFVVLESLINFHVARHTLFVVLEEKPKSILVAPLDENYNICEDKKLEALHRKTSVITALKTPVEFEKFKQMNNELQNLHDLYINKKKEFKKIIDDLKKDHI